MADLNLTCPIKKDIGFDLLAHVFEIVLNIQELFVLQVRKRVGHHRLIIVLRDTVEAAFAEIFFKIGDELSAHLLEFRRREGNQNHSMVKAPFYQLRALVLKQQA